MNPKVFVSHASEDKERFVLDFATKLRRNGIDAWLDKWEMLPGDSLIDKIFNEGIKEAQAFIIVISNNSVNKSWIKEELNAAIIKRMNNGSKLIPVILDNCEVPECLHSTLWEPIENLNYYDTELKRIIMSIYGEKEVPSIGKAPEHLNAIIHNFSSLTKVDSIIFKTSCEIAIKFNTVNQINSNYIYDQIKHFDINESELLETLEILDGRGYIKISKVIGGNIPFFSITVYGFNEYVKLYVNDFKEITRKVSLNIVNKGMNNKSNALELNYPSILVNHVFNLLENKGLINTSKTLDGTIHLNKISPELKRLLM